VVQQIVPGAAMVLAGIAMTRLGNQIFRRGVDGVSQR
jgi:hypothetical protein